MRKYELTYLISDSVPEKDLNKVTGMVSGLISELGGKVDKEDIWGRRKLAYPIKKTDFATYVTLFFNLDADKCKEFERELHSNTSIIRQLMIVKEHGSEKITLTADEIAETGDIEAVVGGEKSFEAIEGETEESRTLMAKREDVEEQTSEVESEKLKVKSNTEEQAPEVKSEKLKVKSTTEEVESRKSKVESKSEDSITDEKETKTEKSAKVAKKEKTSDTQSLSHSETATETKAKVEKETKAKKADDESDRLSKLNDQLDDILKDEL